MSLALALALLAQETRRPALPDLAALRAEGPPALARLCERFDDLPPGVEKDALERAIDAVAAQRYATVSRLYWHTDLDLARAAAQAAGKPILSLRLLGRLDEELCCEDVRLARIALYADPVVARFLRETFVLHWSPERPVPRVTIDFGDGRRIETTIPGKCAHYVLDASGRPLDVLPGLYAPDAFRRELAAAAELARWSPRIAASDRMEFVRAYHVGRIEAAARLGSDPVEAHLSDASRALVARLAGRTSGRAIESLEARVAADTARNELGPRRAIHGWFATFALLPDLDGLNELVFRELFRIPREDPWLGLATPGVFTGLPRDGVVD